MASAFSVIPIPTAEPPTAPSFAAAPFGDRSRVPWARLARWWHARPAVAEDDFEARQY